MDVEHEQREAMEAMYEAGEKLAERLAELQRRFGARLGVDFEQDQAAWRKACSDYRSSISVGARPPPEYTVLNQDGQSRTGSSLLELCSAFTVTYTDAAGLFNVLDGCDQVYGVKLTPHQLIALGEEIRDLGIQPLLRAGGDFVNNG